MRIVCALAGAFLIFLVLVEAFEAMVLPRRVTRPFRLTRFYYRNGWRVWTALSSVWPARRRESFLSVFGPLSLFGLFFVWAAGLVLGFGLLHHGVAKEEATLGDSLYFSGVTFTTLGYGDFTPEGTAGRVLAVAEAATGFGFFAVVIGYLPVLYQSFSKRETLIGLLDARAGSPPSAGRLLVRLAPGRGSALEKFLDQAEAWSAELLESHLSFPVLGYYRSQHDNQSWVATLTCALDTSALLLTVVEGADRTQARLTFAMARHALVDLSLILRRPPKELTADRLPPEGLARLFEALRAAGVTVRDDPTATAKLVELRGLYEPLAVALAALFRVPLPGVCCDSARPDNWQTSAWLRQAAPLTALGVDPLDDHFS